MPPSTLHRAGGFLADFGEWLRALGFHTWTVEKEAGNHLTSFWLHAVLDAHCPKKSQVQFGATRFAAVNPKVTHAPEMWRTVLHCHNAIYRFSFKWLITHRIWWFGGLGPKVHAYARGKGKHLAAAVDLLEKFVQQVWAFEEQAAAPAQTTTMQAQHQAWDQWEVLDMGQYRCPTSERLWYSNDDASSWFMPDADGLRSLCGTWLAREDREGVWWCNETSRQLARRNDLRVV